MHRLFLSLFAIALMVLSLPARAGEFSVRDMWFQRSDQGLSLQADLSAGPSTLLQQLLKSGYTLQFVFEMRFMKKRNWLPDKELGDITWQPEISYDSLLGRYTFKVGERSEEIDSLAEVLLRAGKLRASPSYSEGLARIVTVPDVYLLTRYDLLLENLPQPLQVSLLTDDWPIFSGWKTFAIEVRE
ncbi:DUF4390 domain-containing protein [Candidatus Persebacteraceae bacterium Df01]|jgi:hypothetical protein|uniref:DUF4390 domain-containing protein n=1 Tax=Candidatus Doriopsillibacter californiensis TaxID=2970740 RepID=A0ABT7QLE9_9GAMM|nr:DUF4390 domain-containing protein [Candidatus Persebacteraceae bacterium Df01]